MKINFNTAVKKLQSIKTNNVYMYIFPFKEYNIELYFTNSPHHQFLIMVVNQPSFIFVKNILFYFQNDYWAIDQSMGRLHSKVFPMLSVNNQYDHFYTNLLNVLCDIEYYFFQEIKLYTAVEHINQYVKVMNMSINKLQASNDEFIENVDPFIHKLSTSQFEDAISFSNCAFSLGNGFANFIHKNFYISTSQKCNFQNVCFIRPHLL